MSHSIQPFVIRVLLYVLLFQILIYDSIKYSFLLIQVQFCCAIQRIQPQYILNFEKMSIAQSTFKAALRLKVKDVLLKLSADSKKAQSDAITKMVNFHQ